MLLLHGWPGSFLEFLGTLDILREKYKPEDLPFHVIVPSLPGYGYTNGPRLDKDFDIEGAARVLDKLMIGLGFGDGYISQGGDIGSFLTRVIAVTSDSCKAAHIHWCIGQQGDTANLTNAEKKGVERCIDFATLGNSYARGESSRAETIVFRSIADPFLLESTVTAPPLSASSSPLRPQRS